jgi:hypothetical protein
MAQKNAIEQAKSCDTAIRAKMRYKDSHMVPPSPIFAPTRTEQLIQAYGQMTRQGKEVQAGSISGYLTG